MPSYNYKTANLSLIKLVTSPSCCVNYHKLLCKPTIKHSASKSGLRCSYLGRVSDISPFWRAITRAAAGRPGDGASAIWARNRALECSCRAVSACPRQGGPGPGPGHRRRLLPRVVAPPPPPGTGRPAAAASPAVDGAAAVQPVSGGWRPSVTSNDLVCQTGATCGRRRRLARREGHDRAEHGWRREGGTEHVWRGARSSAGGGGA